MKVYQVVRDFEGALCRFTGAPYAVTTSSCTMALLLACAFHRVGEVSIPRRTYVSVPMSVIHAGGRVSFRTEDWRGAYQLAPYPIWDCARRFHAGMYQAGQFQCVSFHATKILGDTQGGAILHDSGLADAWLRRARFDGRAEGIAPADDTFTLLGWHCMMTPDVAARLLWKLSILPTDNDDLPNDHYPDLSRAPVFQ